MTISDTDVGGGTENERRYTFIYFSTRCYFWSAFQELVYPRGQWNYGNRLLPMETKMKKLIPFMLTIALFTVPDGPAPFDNMHMVCDIDQKACHWECIYYSKSVEVPKMLDGKCRIFSEMVGCEDRPNPFGNKNSIYL